MAPSAAALLDPTTVPLSPADTLCSVANPRCEAHDSWRTLGMEVYTGQPDSDPDRYHDFYRTGQMTRKKMWETTHLAYGMRALGLLNGETTGLGVGCGVEPLLYFLARHTARLYATDVYGFGWVTAPLEMLHDPRPFAPYDYPEDHLTMLQMNGMSLVMPNNSQDFVYSISTIEHFGGPRFALAHVVEAARILKPGGVLAFSTEFLLKNGNDPEAGFCFNAITLDWLILNSGLELIAPLHLTPVPELLEDPAEIILPEWTIAPDQFDRLSSRLGKSIFTDVTLFLRKP